MEIRQVTPTLPIIVIVTLLFQKFYAICKKFFPLQDYQVLPFLIIESYQLGMLRIVHYSTNLAQKRQRDFLEDVALYLNVPGIHLLGLDVDAVV